MTYLDDALRMPARAGHWTRISRAGMMARCIESVSNAVLTSPHIGLRTRTLPEYVGCDHPPRRGRTRACWHIDLRMDISSA